MKKRLITGIATVSILFPFLAFASFGPLATVGDIAGLQNQLNDLSSELAQLQNTISDNAVFGSANATQPIAGTNYSLAGSGVSATASSIVLTSFTITQSGAKITSAMLSTNFYITLEPGNNNKQEIVSCTGVTQNTNGSATLTGCSRGLLPFTPFTASSTYAFPHGGGTTVILSNPPQLYNELAALGNTEAITGQWTFGSSTIPQVSSDTTNAQDGASNFNLATVGYVASTSFAGVVNGSTIQKGIYQTATTSTIASGTTLGSTGATLALTQNTASTSCPQYSVVETNASGTLNPCFVANQNYSFGSTTLQSLISASTTLNGTTTISSATSSVLTTSAGGTVNGLRGSTSGTLISYGNNGWQSGVQQQYVSLPNLSASSSILATVATWTIPTATTGTFYEIAINAAFSGSNTVSSSSLALNGATLFTCTAAGGQNNGWNTLFNIWMQGTSNAEVIPVIIAPSPGSGSCSYANGFSGSGTITVTSTPTFTIQSKAIQETLNLSSTILYFQ